MRIEQFSHEGQISSGTPWTSDRRVDTCARLGGPDERLPVDGVQAELLGVAEDPLEVVHQRPVAVAEHRDAIVDRVQQPGQRRRDEGGPLGVVIGGDTVLGDQDRSSG